MRYRRSSVNPRDHGSSFVPEADARFTLLFDVWLVSRSTLGLLDDALGPVEIDAEDFAVYSLLRTAGRITPTELSRWMATPPTTVSSFVKRYERRGHVRRVPDPDDGRSYWIELTRAGVRIHARAAALFLPALERVEAELRVPARSVSKLLLELRRALDTARYPDRAS